MQAIREVESLSSALNDLADYLAPQNLTAVQVVIRKSEGFKRVNRMLDEARLLKQASKTMILLEFVNRLTQIPDTAMTLERFHTEVQTKLGELKEVLA